MTSALVDELKKEKLDQGKQIRLFCSGKEMGMDKEIGFYTTEDSTVTVFLRNPVPA